MSIVMWKDWLAGLSVDVIGGAEKMAVLDGVTPKNITTDLMADYAIDKLVAAAAVTPTAGDAILMERSGAEGTFDLAALASYVVGSAWTVATEVSPATDVDKFLVNRSGTVYELDIDTVASYVNGAILDLTGLTPATPGSSDLFLFGAGANPRKITLANLETQLWTDFATYAGALAAVTTTAATDKFYCIQGGTPKQVTPVQLAAYIVPNAGDTVAPLTTTPGRVPAWDTAAKTLTDGYTVVTSVRTVAGGAVNTAFATERAVREAIGSLTSLDIVGGVDIGAALVDGDLFIVDDGAAGVIRKSALSRVWTYITTKIQGLTAKTTPVDADILLIQDSADSNALKELTVASLWDNRYVTDAMAIKLDDFAAPDDNTDRDATTLLHGLMSKLDKVKLDGIEELADVTDAANVDAAGATMNTDADVSANAWVIDEDNMVSDLATRVPTQQSVKAYVDAEVTGATYGGSITTLDIDGGVDIGAAIADADLFIVDDGGAGTNRKCAASRLLTYAQTIKLDDFAAPDDNTDLNASSTRHGLLMKLENTGTKVLYDNGTWADPPGATGGEANTVANVGSGEDVFKEKSGTELRFRGIAAGSNRVSVTTNGDNIEVDIAGDVVGRWRTIATSRYTATPASTSSITMSNTAGITVGTPIRYTYSATVFYGIVTAVTADTSITVAGAPLNTGVALTALEIGNPEQVVQLATFVGGNYADDQDDLLVADMKAYVRWKLGRGYLVQMEFTHATAAGTTQPWINVKVGGDLVGTADTVLGLQLSTAGAWVESAVATDTTNYVIDRNEAIELTCTAAGVGDAAENLSGNLVFVLE